MDVQSGGNAYFVGDLTTLKTNDALASPEAALQFAEDLRRHGGKPAVGLLGIPLEWAGRYGRPPIELFDGCINVAVATAAFQAYQADCAPPHHPPSLRNGAANRSRGIRRHVDPAAQRSCLLLRFANDLGLQAAPAAFLRRLATGTSMQPGKNRNTAPDTSFVFVDGAEAQRGDRVAPLRPGIFLDAATATSDAR